MWLSGFYVGKSPRRQAAASHLLWSMSRFHNHRTRTLCSSMFGRCIIIPSFFTKPSLSDVGIFKKTTFVIHYRSIDFSSSFKAVFKCTSVTSKVPTRVDVIPKFSYQYFHKSLLYIFWAMLRATLKFLHTYFRKCQQEIF